MTNERWLKWAIARYYRSFGFRVSMKPARAGNAMVDGVVVRELVDKASLDSRFRISDQVGLYLLNELACESAREPYILIDHVKR